MKGKGNKEKGEQKLNGGQERYGSEFKGRKNRL